MEHMNGWCFRGIYKGGLWENDLHVSAQTGIVYWHNQRGVRTPCCGGLPQHLQTTSIRCPIDYRIIWFCCKTLLKHLKDSDVLPHVKMFSTIIVYLLSEH